jgi:hypothetical protein
MNPGQTVRDGDDGYRRVHAHPSLLLSLDAAVTVGFVGVGLQALFGIENLVALDQ